MNSAESFLSSFKVRIDKVPSKDQSKFLSRTQYCLTQAKTNLAKTRLYQTAIIQIHYNWMQYLDQLLG